MCLGKFLNVFQQINENHKLLSYPTRSVNFKKMMPKAGVFKQSEVFQVLNDQQLKTRAEQEKEEKYQWTTFLQKPQRPPPLRTPQQSVGSSYKPVIVKQPKPKCAPDYRQPTPVRFPNDKLKHDFEKTFFLLLGTASSSSSRNTTNRGKCHRRSCRTAM